MHRELKHQNKTATIINMQTQAFIQQNVPLISQMGQPMMLPQPQMGQPMMAPQPQMGQPIMAPQQDATKMDPSVSPVVTQQPAMIHADPPPPYNPTYPQ